MVCIICAFNSKDNRVMLYNLSADCSYLLEKSALLKFMERHTILYYPSGTCVFIGYGYVVVGDWCVDNWCMFSSTYKFVNSMRGLTISDQREALLSYLWSLGL